MRTPSRVRWLVAGVSAGAIAAVGLLVQADLAGHGGPPPRALTQTAGLLILTFLADYVAVRLRVGDSVTELTLVEAAIVADVLLLPAGMALAVVAVAGGLASIARRRGAVKTLFNTATYTLGTAALAGAYRVVAGGGGPFGLRGIVGMLFGATLFTGLNLILIAAVLAAATGLSFAATLRERARLVTLMTVGTAGLGLVAVALGRTAPLLLPAVALPAAALMFAYRAVVQQAEERERSHALLDLSALLARGLTADGTDPLLEALRCALRAETATVVFDTATGPVALRGSAGRVTTGAATADEVAIRQRLRDTRVPEVTITGRDRSVVSVELAGDGSSVGALTVEVPRRISDRDTLLLAALASAVAAAVVARGHFLRLEQEKEKLQAVVDHSTDGILVLDAAGRVLVWNPAMATLTGTPAGGAVGRDVRALLTLTDEQGNPADLGADLRLLRPERNRGRTCGSVQRGDGTTRWVVASHAGIFEDGQLTRDVVLVHDVTRERELDRAKSDFVATVSHELRTPLTPIIGYTDLLRRKGDAVDAELRRTALDVVADKAAHLLRLVDDLLLTSEIGTAGTAPLPVHPDVVDARGVVRRAAAGFGVDGRSVTVALPDDEVLVHADPDRAVQVLANLISNGLKYSTGDVEVRLTPAAAGTPARVSVTDTGRGIPAEHLERIFTPFTRLEPPDRMTTGGSGVGLYIARQLAQAMGGEITVSSEVGAGSTFTVTLADVPALPALPAPRGSTEPQPRRVPAR